MKIVVPIMPTSLEEAQELELSRFEGRQMRFLNLTHEYLNGCSSYF